MRNVFLQQNRSEIFRAETILAQKLTRLRLALASRIEDKERKFTEEELHAFIENIRACAKDEQQFDREARNVHFAIKKRSAPAEPDLSRPELQLLWGAAIHYLDRNKEVQHGSPDYRGYGGYWKSTVEVVSTELWKQLLESPYAKEVLYNHALYISEELRRPDTRFAWAEPGSGVKYDREKNTINVDFLQSLVSGIEHAHSVMFREIGKSQLSTMFPEQNRKIRNQMVALKEKQEAGKLSDAEYKKLRKLGLEWEMRKMLWEAAERCATNRYTERKGQEKAQDYAYSLNHHLMSSTHFGHNALEEFRAQQRAREQAKQQAREVLNVLKEHMAEHKHNMPSEMRKAFEQQVEQLESKVSGTPEQRFINVLNAISLSFFKNNGLFDHSRENWERFGIDVDGIKITKEEARAEIADKIANDAVGKDGFPPADFRHLLDMCGGLRGLESLQPRSRDRWLGKTYFKGLTDSYAEKRNALIEKIWDLYIDDIAQELLNNLDEQLDEELGNDPQQNQQNGQDQQQGQQNQQNQQNQQGQQNQQNQQNQQGQQGQQDQQDGQQQDQQGQQSQQQDGQQQNQQGQQKQPQKGDPSQQQDGQKQDGQQQDGQDSQQDGQDGQQQDGQDGQQDGQDGQEQGQDGQQDGQDGQEQGQDGQQDGQDGQQQGQDGQQDGQNGQQQGQGQGQQQDYGPDEKPFGENESGRSEGQKQDGQQQGQQGQDGQQQGQDGQQQGQQQGQQDGQQGQQGGQQGQQGGEKQQGQEFDPSQAGTDQDGKKVDVTNDKGQDKKMPDVDLPPENPEGQDPSQDANGQDADGQGQDGKEGAEGKTLEQIKKEIEEAMKKAQEEAQQGQDGQDGQPGEGQPGEGQPGDGEGQGEGEGDTPSNSAGDGGEAKTLEEIASMEWTSYQAVVGQLKSYIAQTAKLLEKIRDRQLEKTVKRSSQLEMLPEGKEMDRLSHEAHRNFITKRVTGQELEKEDLHRFHKDEKDQKPTTIDIVLLIDGSGSMTMDYYKLGTAKPMDVALLSSMILYEAAKKVDANVYIALWGNDDPIILAKPGDDPRDAESNILKAKKGMNCGTNLAPSIKKITKVLSEHKSSQYSGYTHMMVLSDGDISDPEPAKKAINTLLSTTEYATLEFAVMKKDGEQKTAMEKVAESLRISNPTQKIGIHRDGNPNSIPAGIVGLIFQKIRMLESFAAVPWAKKRKLFQRTNMKFDKR